MERLYITIFSILISLLVGLIAYWLKSTHREIKGLISHLTDFTNKLKGLIIGIETHIEKGIEADIRETKEDVKELQARITHTERQISTLNAQSTQ